MKSVLSALVLVASLLPSQLRAEVKPAAIFSDHMVLQAALPIPVWGSANPGEKISVTINGQTRTTTTAADRRWMLKLDPLKTSATPTEMIISGSNRIAIKDVLIGECWLGSGQSNMEFSVSKAAKRFAGVNNEEAEIAAADYPTIRMFTVKMALSEEPQDDCTGEWQVCSPKTVGSFSAVGYFFCRQLQKAIDQPVGFINASYGASVAQAWISRVDLEADPRFTGLLKDLAKQKLEYSLSQRGALATTEPATIGKKNKGPPNPISNHSPYMLWNAMLHPVQPYAIRGFLWYQGESIIGGTAMYSQLMQTLITTWRREWGEGELPFYFVQLAALDAASNKPEVREAQAKALSIPNTAMAVTIDIGDKKNVHPKNKQDVGDRLARIARALVYGEKIEYSGPVYESMKVEGSKVRIHFTHIGAGLMAKDGVLKQFQIAGQDHKFVPADAVIDGDSIIVSSDDEPAPVAVRYAWSSWPEGCNLYNKDGLPAPPFRTDGW